MKKTVTLLLALGTLSLGAQSSVENFQQAANEAEQRLEAALDELDRIQQEVNEKRPDLGAKLDDVEAEALRLRDEASNVARIKAGFDVEVSQLQNEKESIIENNNYIQSTLLNEYIRRLDLTINPSEIPIYHEQILETLSFLETEEEVDDATIFESQLKVLRLALGRVEKVLGGDTFAGTAIVEGTLVEGDFALLGPVSYFSGADTAGITDGMIDNRANIAPLPEYSQGIISTAQQGSGQLPIDTTDGEV